MCGSENGRTRISTSLPPKDVPASLRLLLLHHLLLLLLLLHLYPSLVRSFVAAAAAAAHQPPGSSDRFPAQTAFRSGQYKRARVNKWGKIIIIIVKNYFSVNRYDNIIFSTLATRLSLWRRARAREWEGSKEKKKNKIITFLFTTAILHTRVARWLLCFVTFYYFKMSRFLSLENRFTKKKKNPYKLRIHFLPIIK